MKFCGGSSGVRNSPRTYIEATGPIRLDGVPLFEWRTLWPAGSEQAQRSGAVHGFEPEIDPTMYAGETAQMLMCQTNV